jgi:acetolactate synthase-1/2/3 large subunit
VKVEAKKLEVQTSTAPRTGADLLIDLLKKEGVETLFGYPGGAVLPIYDAIYRAQGTIKHILFRHEQGMIHAAEGYARAQGVWGMPGRQAAKKGVENCDKLGGAVKRALIPRCPNRPALNK